MNVMHAQKTSLKSGLSHLFAMFSLETISLEVKLPQKISKNQLFLIFDFFIIYLIEIIL